MSTPVAPAQIQLALMPNGPANPPLLDMATEAPPEFYAGGDVAFLLAMFDQFGNVLDASSLSALTLSLYDDPTTMNLLASVATITFTATVTLDAWRNAAAQQAIEASGFNAGALRAELERAQQVDQLKLLFSRGDEVMYLGCWHRVACSCSTNRPRISMPHPRRRFWTTRTARVSPR